jgi:hypothetical protein
MSLPSPSKELLKLQDQLRTLATGTVIASQSNSEQIQVASRTMRENSGGRLSEKDTLQFATMAVEGAGAIDDAIQKAVQLLDYQSLVQAGKDAAQASNMILWLRGAGLTETHRYILARAIFNATEKAGLLESLHVLTGRVAAEYLLLVANLGTANRFPRLSLWACQSLIQISSGINDLYYEAMGWIAQGIALSVQGSRKEGRASIEKGLALVPKAEQQINDRAAFMKQVDPRLSGSRDQDYLALLNKVANSARSLLEKMA